MAKMRLYGSLAAACLMGVACVDIPVDQRPPDKVSAVFDPTAAVIPLPSSAALDADGTLPDLGGDGAQGAFHAWLSKSYGWNPATPITFPFSGKLDADSVTADRLRLFKISSDGSFEPLAFTTAYAENTELESPVCNPTVCASLISLLPVEPLEAGARYAAIVTTDVTAGGHPILPSSAMFFAASPTPLVDANGTSLIASLDNGTATQLEGLRGLLAPVLAQVATEGIGRDSVAAATVWGTAGNAFTVLDAASATLPIPNTLALDPDGTFPRAALEYCGPGAEPKACAADGECGNNGLCQSGTCVTTKCAQGVFDDYLDGLHGWPTTTPITLPLTSAVDATTLEGNVRLFRVGEDSLEELPVSLKYDEGGTTIQIEAPMALNTQYIAIATQRIRSVATDAVGDALPLLPAPGIAMAIQPDPVVDVDGRSLVAEIPDSDAAAIAAAQSFMRPAAAAIEGSTGLHHSDLAALWTWSTWTDTFVVFDPATARFPFPTAFATAGCSPERPICALYDPANPPADPLQAAVFDEVSKRDGFSTTGTNWIPVEGAPIDPSSVTAQNVLFAEAHTTIPTLLDAADYAVSFEYDHILLDFERPLKPGILVAGVATTGLKGSNGFSAQPSPAFVFLRSDQPLVDASGKSQVNVLDDATAAQLEEARLAYAQLWIAAQIFGYSRKQVVSAWAYTTAKPTLPLQRLRAEALATVAARGSLVAHRACEPDCGTDANLLTDIPNDGTLSHPDDGRDVEIGYIGDYQFAGEIESIDVLDFNNRIVGVSAFTQPRVGVTVSVPKVDNCGEGPYDVALIQHGLGDYRTAMSLGLANHFAQRCIATVALDLPHHGGRAQGAASLHPASRPANSGDGFLTADLLGSANNLMQAVIDQAVAIRYIREGGLDTLVGRPVSDGSSKIGYVGISMGGFAGTLLSTVEPAVEATVLNVAGGNFRVVLTQSESFSSLLTDAGLMPGSLTYLQTLHFIGWLGEKVDPYTFAPHLIADPLTDLSYDIDAQTYSDGEPMNPRSVLVQMVAGDPTVPNTATEILARTIGVSLSESTFENTFHGFLSGGASAESTCARDQAAEWIASSFAGSPGIPSELVPATCVASRSN